MKITSLAQYLTPLPIPGCRLPHCPAAWLQGWAPTHHHGECLQGRPTAKGSSPPHPTSGLSFPLSCLDVLSVPSPVAAVHPCPPRDESVQGPTSYKAPPQKLADCCLSPKPTAAGVNSTLNLGTLATAGPVGGLGPHSLSLSVFTCKIKDQRKQLALRSFPGVTPLDPAGQTTGPVCEAPATSCALQALGTEWGHGSCLPGARKALGRQDIKHNGIRFP